MTESTISSQILASRDGIRAQISDYVKQYLELEGVDLTKSSFLSFLINVISTLTGNLMFYQMSAYREFFLTKAQLPESIYNLSAFLGYTSSDANYSVANVLITIPLTFTSSPVSFSIPEQFKFYADEVQFLTDYSVDITVENNSTISITMTKDNKLYVIPYTQDADNFYFVLPVNQYEVNIQEFQIEQDIQEYQFINIDVPIDGQVAGTIVEIKGPNEAAYTLWTEFNSLYLMSNTDKGYVRRKSDTGFTLYFGNSLIGVQPDGGSSVRVTTLVTLGEEGNVVAGTIKTGERIYALNVLGNAEVVNYTVTNTNSASGGGDEESIEEIRKNSIAYITALNRLVSEGDYVNANVVVQNSPLAENSLPVLKRSDLKVNDIQLFTTLLYGTDPEDETKQLLVPTKDIYNEFPITQTLIPRGTILTFDNDDYYTMFDIVVNLANNYASYYYTMNQIDQVPTLITSYTSSYSVFADNLIVERVGSSADFRLNYHITQGNPEDILCKMRAQSTGVTYWLTNDSTALIFYTTITPYSLLPEGEETYYFTLYDSLLNPISEYQVKFIFRQNLETFMQSTVLQQDSTSIIIFDIPCILKSYYDSVSVSEFEGQILQALLLTLDFSQYRMLTDFTNLKFTSAYGTLQNMLLNEVTKSPVLDLVTTLPTTPSLNDKYILDNDNPTYPGYIALCTDSTSVSWSYLQPKIDEILYVINKGEKYIYSEQGWIPLPRYSIPLELEIEVVRKPGVIVSISGLSQDIKDALMDAFEDRFGTNVELYRSEIIDVIQEVEGVGHCTLLKPETSIFFNYNIDDFTQEQLLRYSPEYVYFRRENITIRVVG